MRDLWLFIIIVVFEQFLDRKICKTIKKHLFL